MDADIGIIGLGTVGSMTLWQLARKGVSVMGFEQFGIGHDYSAAGGESRIFRTAYGEGSEYVPIMKESYRLWRELEKESGNELLHLTGGLMIGEPGTPFMDNVLKSIERFGLEHEILEGEQAEKRFPQHRLLPGEIMVLDKLAGGLRPELAVVSAVKQAEKLGAKVFSHSLVEGIESGRSGVKVFVNGKEYQFGKVVISTGPWTGVFMPDYKSQITIKRLAMGWFAAKDIKKFRADRFPVYIRESGEDKFYGTPTFDGSMVKAAFYINYGILEHPNDLSRTIMPEDLELLRNAVKQYLPDLYPDPVRASVYMDGFTPDEHALVGSIDDQDRIILLGGFSGHGFKMATAIGKIASDLVLEGKTTFELDHLSPKRFLKENAKQEGLT
ncbi:MAG TPA: FAD-dependent oxidoreductase [Bacillus bacterium]|uniref:N-methyltryptophan oxidase n=1 Tax=Siminovitchia fordii TaxID=254759 RepID=A0ABQ4KBG8_9BACI|nr:N-methyl-L-tryptophan oxidase [Siminovitchia fordii]GIN22356.1 N-methyltryptophan oxidase [Siminovitchia fordii]HBZ11857.1 FAD-dependent oxidoreductase [Bacillus sp. (in: firmicutes)]